MQEKCKLWRLRKQAVLTTARLREIREEERQRFIRELREKAAVHIQRIFRGIVGRTMVVELAVEKQVFQAQERVNEITNNPEQNKKTHIESKRNKYKNIASGQTPKSRRKEGVKEE